MFSEYEPRGLSTSNSSIKTIMSPAGAGNLGAVHRDHHRRQESRTPGRAGQPPGRVARASPDSAPSERTDIETVARIHTGQATLMAAARRGDRAAFAELVERHRPVLTALCRRALADPELAEDAVQEAVLLAMTSLDRLRQVDRFGSWLAGIGLNVCRRWLRERSRESWSWEAVQGGRAADRPAAGPGPEELAEAAELAARIRRAVAGLPAGQRTAVTLYYLAGLSQAEVAAYAGTSIAAVKTRLHKGRAGLREQLRPWWKEEHMGTAAAVEMRVADVRRAPGGDEAPARHVILLEEVGGSRRLPIWVGMFEATALAITMTGTDLPRPGTYRFAASLLEAVRGQLAEVRVNRLAEGTFYAEAVLDGPEAQGRVDARPSDALNLALLVGAPIRVEAAVLDACEAARSGSPRLREMAGEVDAYPDGADEIVAEARAEWARAMAVFEAARAPGQSAPGQSAPGGQATGGLGAGGQGACGAGVT
jgi:RNA polymerase sigma-70 factor (ECF subfamily)